ncbi:MAG: zinc ribbon domain-containing protein [Deltaproteobacteria bacterium]|nr:zinc ribbon domain-containing protein [Deltaproteobacteria bacterium]
MPMYEYRCENCGLVFEVRQKFSDAPVAFCSACGAPVKKLISLTEFALKGGGWYQQGYCQGGGSASGCSGSGSSGCARCPKAANG